MKFTSIDKDIATVLNTGFYRVPRFQRPYSWTREEVEEFWNDVLAESEPHYFIGSIVVYKEGASVFGIVDGQQRLTTITMLLCSLRNAFAATGHPDLAKGTHSMVERSDIDDLPHYIIQTETSYPFFQEGIQKPGPLPYTDEVGAEERVLKEAFEFLDGQVQGAVQSIVSDTTLSKAGVARAVKAKLRAMRDSVLQLALILVELDSEDDAYLAFETLNSRGKDLRISDLVKNVITKSLRRTNRRVDIARDKWQKILDTIEGTSARVSIDSFIHHYWLSVHDYVSEKRLFKPIKRHVTAGTATALLDSLVTESVFYRALFEPDASSWSKPEVPIRESLRALAVFRIRQAAPLLLALLAQLRLGTLRPKQVHSAINAIETFHFMYTVITSQSSSGGISKMYAVHARAIREGTREDKVNSLNDLRHKLKSRLPSLEEFVAGFTQLQYSSEFTRDRHLVRYVLGRIARSKTKISTLDYSRMTIEHIDPESSCSGGYANIGNLVLTSDELNQRLGTRAFPAKKEVLRKAREVWIDPVLSLAGIWGDREIESRAEQLGRTAFDEVWKI